MNDLDESWAAMLIAAGERAAIKGRADVVEYLRLKATNDAIRGAGVKWLLEAFIAAAFGSAAAHTLKIDRIEGHTFIHGQSTMAGTLVTIRHGVRCLSVEAGWTRTPSHGIMRGAALARANVLHFGRGRENENLKLVHGSDLPQWVTDSAATFTLSDIGRHLDALISD